MNTKKELKQNYEPAIRLAAISLLLCGLAFPLLVTGFAQALMPYQANGSLATFNGRNVGSNLIAQNFTKPIFFHPRNDSASGVDPDITIEDALSQVPRIQSHTNLTYDELAQVIKENQEGIFWVFGTSYVNVLRLNLDLIQKYPGTYPNFR